LEALLGFPVSRLLLAVWPWGALSCVVWRRPTSHHVFFQFFLVVSWVDSTKLEQVVA
jgi:hypothetical protein